MVSRTLLLSTLLCVACQSAPDPRWAAIDRGQHPFADAVILLDEARLTFESDPADGYRLERVTRVKVLTPAGRDAAEVAIPLDAWTTLESFESWSSAVDGSDRMTADMASLYTVAARPDAGVLFSDGRVARTLVPGVDVGDVFEYRSVVRVKQTFLLPTWIFEARLPVLTSRLMVDARVGQAIKWSFAEDGKLANFEPDRADGWLTWTLTDRDAFEPIEYGPPVGQQFAQLRLLLRDSPAGESWGSVAGWYHGLTRDRLDLPVALRQRLLKSAKGLSDAQKAQLVFDWVRDRVRYVATHIGIGAFKPHKVSEVLRHGYGDCKDMVTTALALARALKIDAQPVLVGARGHGVDDPQLAAVSTFNHVIIGFKVDGRWIYGDPTAKQTMLGEIPRPLQGRTGLRVGEGIAKRVTLPALSAAANHTTVAWHFGEGDLLRLDVTLQGLGAQAWRRPMSPAQLRSAVHGAFFDVFDGVELKTVASSVDGASVKLIATARWTGAWTALGADREGLALHPLLARSAEVRVPAERKTAVHLGPPRRRTITIDLPWTADRAVHLPKSSEAVGPVGHSRWSVEPGPDRVRLIHEMNLGAEVVPPTSLAALRALSEHGARISRELLVRRIGGAQ